MKQQKGFGLLEMLAAITVSSVMFAGLANMAGDAQKQIKETTTAQHFKQWIDAATRYVQDNSATIQATATATTPAVITTTMLQTTGYLPASFTGSNPYGQSLQVEVLQPTTGNLQATVLSLGGSTIPDLQAHRIAAKVGANGGSTSSANPTTAQGAFGGWSQALTHNTQPGAGHLVGMLYFNNGQLVSDYLRRHSVAGHPEVNQMFTTLDMNSQTVSNANQVNAQKVNLPAGNSLQIGNSYYYGDGANSAIRQSGGLYVQNQTGSSLLFGTDSSGNTSNPGWSTVGGAIVTQYLADSNNTGYQIDPNGTSRTNYTIQDNEYTYGWQQANIYYDAYNNGYYMQPRGTNRMNYVLADNAEAYGTVTPGWQVETWGCSPNGAIGRAAYDTTYGWAYSGKSLTCENGVWRQSGGGADSGTICGWNEVNFNLVSNSWGSNTSLCKGNNPAASCPPGYTQYFSWAYGYSHYNSAWCAKN